MASDANAGERQQALFEKMYLHKRFRVTHGRNAPETLDAASDLVAALLAVGRPYAAYGLAHKTLRRSRRVLGDDHPDTLGTAAKLIVALSELGRHKSAHALAEDTLPRARRVLGPDHPDTLACERNLSAPPRPRR
jgi:hypothetical protein